MSNHRTPQRGASDRIRSMAAATMGRIVLLSTLVTASTALSSCLFLAPDAQERTHVRLAIEATADAASAMRSLTSAGGAEKSPSCADAGDYLLTPEQLAGVARVWRLPDANQADLVLLQEAPLTVGALDAQQRLVLSGELDLPVAAAGTSYRLEVSLMARGDRLVTQLEAGHFSGSIELASGLSIQVERLLLAPSASNTTDAVLSVSSPAVNDGQPGIFALQGIELDLQTGSFSARYEDPEMPFDDGVRHLVVDVHGRLKPVSLFAGETELAVLPAGVRQDIHLQLQPTGDVPGSAGEYLGADLVFELVDGIPLRETGTMLLARETSICPQQAP